MFKRKFVFVILAFAVVAVGAYSLWPVTSPPRGDPFKVTMHLWPGYYHSFIALEKGFFEEEGVNAELTIVEDIDANIQAFVDGKADAAFGLQSDAMLLAASGVPVKIVYVVDYSNGGDVVISRPNIRTISDLKGTRIGVDKLNGFNHVFIAELLRINGMSEDDVEILPVRASAVPAALAEGRIDAGQTWEPYTSEARASKAFI
jgi:NitT/TauT family transport system substrate-binding protein